MTYPKHYLVFPFAYLISLFACTVAFAVSTSAKPAVINASYSLDTFLAVSGKAEFAAQPSDAHSSTMLSLPSLYIYSPSGDLVYQGGGKDEDTQESVDLVRGLPATAERLKPIPYTPKVRAMLDIVPEFKAAEQTLLRDGHYVVYYVTVEPHRVTKSQQAIIDLRNRAKGAPVDTLLLRLQQ